MFLSHGSNTLPGADDTIAVLRSNALAEHPGWGVQMVGTDTGCNLAATTNVQGRLLNGVAASQVCGTAAASYSQRFVSAEQDPGFRDPLDWVGPIQTTWP